MANSILNNFTGGYGLMGIDTTNVLATMTTYDDTWIATADCYMLGQTGSTYMNDRFVVIDGVTVQNWRSTTNAGEQPLYGMFMPLKKGQTIRVYVGDSRRGANAITFYGLKRY